MPSFDIHPQGRGAVVTDDLELRTLYTVDLSGTCTWPDDRDPAGVWLAVIVREGKLYRVVWMRPEMRSVGAELGAADLLADPVVMQQVARLGYEPVRRMPPARPPVHLAAGLIRALA